MPYATYLGNAGLSERSDLGGLNLSDVPKVFIETGNMRSATDAARCSRARRFANRPPKPSPAASPTTSPDAEPCRTPRRSG